MSENNQKTLNSYEDHIEEYINGTPQEVSGDVKLWIDKTLENLPTTANILELGSAFGRDADYIESFGYTVKRTDATRGFVEYLRSNGNEGVGVLNVITDELPMQQDLIFADAVLLHFTDKETEHVISKVYEALNAGGFFSFSLKRGTGEEWSDAKLGSPRYFKYWESDDISRLLRAAGFSILDMQDGSLGRSNAKWLHIIAKK